MAEKQLKRGGRLWPAQRAAVYESRAGLKLEKEIILAELQTKGYVEHECHVTDDEGTNDEGSGDM